jgi:DNA-directed RNA polymerase specialized sigma24 family protein
VACEPEPFDVLELGEALVAARPHLRRRAEPLARTPEEADRLVERTLKQVWCERRSFRDADDVNAWLASQLTRAH